MPMNFVLNIDTKRPEIGYVNGQLDMNGFDVEGFDADVLYVERRTDDDGRDVVCVVFHLDHPDA